VLPYKAAKNHGFSNYLFLTNVFGGDLSNPPAGEIYFSWDKRDGKFT